MNTDQTTRPRTGRVLARLVVLMIFLLCTRSSMALRNVKVGEKIPSFTVVSIDGRQVSIDEFANKPLLLLFARPDHADSLSAIKTVHGVVKDIPNDKLAVLVVSTSEEGQAYFKKTRDELKFSRPIALDANRKMYGDFGLIVAPTTLLIDKSGVLRYELPHLPPGFARKLRIYTEFLLGQVSRQDMEKQVAQVVHVAPAPPDRQLAFARLLATQGKREQAIPILEGLRKTQKDSVGVATLLANCYLKSGRIEDAAACLESLPDLRPAPPMLSLARARLEIARGHDKRAEPLLTAAIDALAGKAEALYELGRLYERQKEPGKALECYRRALEEVLGEGPPKTFPAAGSPDLGDSR